MDDADSGHAVEISIRFPPFDPNTVIASEIPIAREYFSLKDNSNVLVPFESETKQIFIFIEIS